MLFIKLSHKNKFFLKLHLLKLKIKYNKNLKEQKVTLKPLIKIKNYLVLIKLRSKN